MDNVTVADTLDPVGIIELPDPECEAMAERLAEAEWQLRYGDPARAAELIADVMGQMIDMAAGQ